MSSKSTIKVGKGAVVGGVFGAHSATSVGKGSKAKTVGAPQGVDVNQMPSASASFGINFNDANVEVEEGALVCATVLPKSSVAVGDGATSEVLNVEEDKVRKDAGRKAEDKEEDVRLGVPPSDQ